MQFIQTIGFDVKREHENLLVDYSSNGLTETVSDAVSSKIAVRSLVLRWSTLETCSSELSARAKKRTRTGSVWPIRCTLMAACAFSAGTHEHSAKATSCAAVKVMAVPA